MSPMMPYGSSGGKGGSMGGFQTPGLADYSGAQGAGGKGGSDAGAPAPATPSSPAATAPAPAPAPMPAAPADNAFTQGVGAQDQAMDFFSGAMGGNNDFIMDMIKNMAGGGNNTIVASMGGGGAPVVMPELQGIAKDLYDYDPAQVNAQGYQAAQLSDADLSQYMNPYQQDVIDTSINDLDRARKQALNSTGVEATRGGGFGGDRHGVMEAMDNSEYYNNVARTSANLRNQGYQNAQNAAMSDINALNQQRGYNAQEQMAANMANAQSANDRSQFTGSTAAQAEMQKQQLEAQMAMQRAASGGGGSNSAAIAQANAQLKAQSQQNALQAAMQMYGMQYDAANQLYNMGGDRYDMGQEATANLANVGNQVDQINQGLINQIQDQFNNQQNAPQTQYNQMIAALSGQPNWGGTQSYNPGVYDAIGLATGLGGAFMGGK